MTTESPKKRNTTGPIDEFTCAARVCRILEAWQTDCADVEKAVRGAIEDLQEKRQMEIRALYHRVPEDRRQAANDLVAARRLPLCGFELYAPPSNDSPSEPPGSEVRVDPMTHRLGPDGPIPKTPRVEIERKVPRQ